jgi:PKD repeat protein/photosystem II stability/assembly factor-like uncharacterized protein
VRNQPFNLSNKIKMKKFTILLTVLISVAVTTNAQWVSTNGPIGSHIPCFALSGTNIFAGTYGGGVFLSTNDGANWTAVNTGLNNNNLIEALAVSGANLFAGTRGGGVFLSKNNGTSWAAVNTGLTSTDIWALAVSGTNLFAGTWGGGVFLSTDTGTSWTAVNTGLTENRIWALTVSGTNIFAGTYGSGVFLSTNSGTTWTAVNTGLPINSSITAFTVDGTNIFAGIWGSGVYLSTNNGTSWTAANSGIYDFVVNDLTMNGTNLFAAIKDRGIYRSGNNGTSWTRVNTGLTSTAVMGLGKSGTNIFAGSSEGIFLSANDGASWTAVNNGLTDHIVQFLSLNGSNLSAGTYGGMYISPDNGTSWNLSGLPITSVESFAQIGTNQFAGTWDGLYRSTDNGANWTNTNAGFSPGVIIANGANLFAGSFGGGVFLSTNNGTSWTAVNTGLTNTNVRALAFSGTNLFAGTWGGGVFLSPDNGASWTAVNTGLTNNNVCALVVSGTNIFTGTGGGGVFISTNNGTSWSAFNSGLGNTNLTVLGINGTNLYAGTWGSGVFISSINGLTWTPANSAGLSNSNIRSLALSNTDIFVGTQGNGVYRRALSEITGISNEVPNAGFENWISVNQPANWLVRTTTASKSNDRYTGNYALKLQTTIQSGNNDGSGTINSLPPSGFEGAQPAFPVSERYSTLNGYYKFSPLNGDSCQFMVMLYKNGYVNPISPAYGNLVGYGQLCKSTSTIYAPFTVSIKYFDGFTIPDSAWISLNAYKDYDFITMTSGSPLGNSTLYVDDLNFDNPVIEANAQWKVQASGTTNVLNSVFFENANTGYAVGAMGTILKTADSGTTWTSQLSGTTNGLNSIYFTDANTGYAVGQNGTILKTSDGGTNWIIQTSGTLNVLFSIYFVNSNTGYTVGQNGTILKTIDGGTNWSTQTSGTLNFLRSVCFIDANTGYTVGIPGTILKTTDGGVSWTAQTAGTINNLVSVKITGPNTAYIVGDAGTILKTTDGGASWISQKSNTINALLSVYTASQDTVYAVGYYGTILKTTDGGTNWTTLASGTGYILRSVCFTDTNTGYAVGVNGTILKTTNGGVDENALYSNATLNGPWFFHIEPLSPYNDSLAYFVFDGNGNIIDMSGFSGPMGGTYSVSSNGAFSGNLTIDIDTYPLSGQLTSQNTGTCSAAGMNWKISRIANTGALSDSLVGTLYTQNCGQKDVTIRLNSQGEVISAIGLLPPVTGRIYADLGVYMGHLKTGDIINNGWNEFSIMGYYADNSLEGKVALEAPPGSCGNTVSQLIRKGPAPGNNFGFEQWNDMGSYMVPQGYATPNTYATGTFYPVTRSTDHYPASVGNYSIRIESNISLLPGEEHPDAFGVVLQNKSNSVADWPGPAFSITGHPTSLTGYYKYAPQNGDTMRITLVLYLNGEVVSYNAFLSTATVSNWTSFILPLPVYTSADSGTIILASYNADGGAPEFIPYGNSVLYVDNLNFDNLIVEKNNFGFEDWTTAGNYENPDDWATMNPYGTGPFYSCTKSTDHYPESVGNYSIRLENNTLLGQMNGGYGMAITNAFDWPFKPAFPISGHPNSLTGYYKFNSLNNDSMFIRVILFQNGTMVGNNMFVTSNTATTWTPFTIPLTYTSADSATIHLSAFYPSGPTDGPNGNSVLYVDNLNFDNLITEKINFGFEQWTDMGSFMEPQGYATANAYATGTFYPVTRSTDHYPASVGNYSIRIESNISLLAGESPAAYGIVLQNSRNTLMDDPGPVFPIMGHPTSLTGYYKYAPQNGDTMRIQIVLYSNGEAVTYNAFLSTASVSNWTSFILPLPAYVSADSGTIILASYSANGRGPSDIPHGNSVLYVDNLNFDKLITGVNCQADFDAVINSTSGLANFTSKSQGEDAYYWDFGDGYYSTQQNPSHTYTKAGAYHVCLTIMNSTNECQSVICKNIIYIPSGEFYIQADFSFVPNLTDYSVIFNDLSTSNTSDWYWTMGDGKVIKTRNPVYTYAKPGVYQVCLTAFDNVNSLSNSICKEVRVGEITCTIASDFTWFIDPVSRDVAFSGLSGGAPDNFFWTFGDGSSSTLENPLHNYSTAGYYKVSLAVRNSGNNCMDISSQIIQVGSVDCRAGFTFRVDPDINNTVYFTDDSKGLIDYYYWDFGDGSFSVDQNPEQLYSKAGMYMVGQTVIDNANACIDFTFQPVQVGEVNCAADFVSYIDSASYTAYYTNRVLGMSTALLWSFGDGKFSTAQNPVNVFPGTGIYSTGLNTYDFNNGCMDYYEEMLLIGGIGADCNADFAYRVDPLNNEVTFSNKSTGDITGSIWNFGDESDNSTLTDPVHPYTTGGYYYVCLSVINSAGTKNMGCKWVLIPGNTAADCRANFMFTIDSANLKVKFVDNSYGDIDKYSWDFGDSKADSVSIVQHPEHTYAQKGYYLVRLNVENTASGCVSNEYKLLNIAESQVLKAAFGYEAREPNKKIAGYPVDLVSASSGDGATVEWDFGDKQIKKESFTIMDSTSRIVTHYYQLSGKYRVCLRISDPVSGQSDEYCEWVATKNAIGIDKVSESEVNLDVYPNPFMSFTTISYALPKPQFIEIAVFDQLGRWLETLVKTRKDAGTYQIVWETKTLATGVYHLKLVTAEGTITKQLVITK